ncbi:fungal-specific transcription factor domain-containing protein [Aspergillus carlsbadensis]|nr:fungal-specific transcription factor domain-containing protein [Aspergillus carlsbadensis]
MNGSKEIDLPPEESRRRTSNRQLECTYLGVRRRGRGKAFVDYLEVGANLERLEAIVGELETSVQHATSAPLGSASNNTFSIETYGDKAQPTLPDALHLNTSLEDHDKVEAAMKDRLLTTLYDKTTLEEPRLEANGAPVITPSLFEVTFAKVNHMALVFDIPVLLGLLDEHFSHSPTFSQDNYPQKWAMLNTAVAVAIQLRAAKGSESEMMQISWAFFKNAFGMYVPITLRGADILALEAILAMAIYMQTSSDLRTMSILVSAGARLALTLGLHRKTYYSGLGFVAANRARRAFWTCFVLDKDTSLKTGLPSNLDEEALSVDHLDLIVPAASPTGTSPGAGPRADMSSAASTLLQSSVKLAILRSTVDKLLYSKFSSEQSIQQLLNTVAELEHQLLNWKATLPFNLQLDHMNQPTTALIARPPIILLHSAYYSTLCEIHGFAAHLDYGGDTGIMWQVKTATIAQVSVATEIIRLLQFVSREEQPGDLWHLLFYPISACITLVSVILENPMDPQARSRGQHVTNLIKFLRDLQRDRIPEVQGLLDLCCEFERLVLDTISNAANRITSTGLPSNAITPRLDATSSLQLASGIMGNIPRLCSVAASTFSGLVPKMQMPPSSSLVALSSLNPETYGFTFA